MTMPADLARLTEAAQMLAEARTLPEIRRIHNLAQRAQDYAKAARLGLDAQNSAAAIALEAEARAGELLQRMAETGERATRAANLNSGPNRAAHGSGPVVTEPAGARAQAPNPATLDDLGITEHESRTWQAVAQVPPETRQRYVTTAQEREVEVTRAGLLRHAGVTPEPRPRPTPVAPLGQPATTLEPEPELPRPPAEATRRIARAHLIEHLQMARGDVDRAHPLSAEDREQVATHLDYIRWRALGDTPALREVRDGS